jgi:hypothetical protein
MRKFGFIVLGLVLVASPLLAQNPTGTITGQCTYEGGPLPGVTVSISSEVMQGGTKTAITNEAGTYIFRFLPPGDYDVVFSLESFQTLKKPVKVAISQTKTIDAVMYPKEVTEEITVTAAYETISATSQANVTFEQDLVEDLPVGRDIQSAALLAPGVAANAGHSGAVNIAGAPGPQSLFMVNGVVLNDTVWGNPFSLYIEDAVVETTASVSGISAEYGRFTGGVINMITKSGGNEFSGSYRLNMTNDDWASATPLTTDQEDKINQTHEATLGGYIMKDRLWFFLAGRQFERDRLDQMRNPLRTTYPNIREQLRYEAKLTFSPNMSHRILGSFMNVDDEEQGRTRLPAIEPDAIIDRETPQDMLALNYTGVLSEAFFVEGQYSERNFMFKDSGSKASPGDRINGSGIMIVDLGSAMAGTHLFCADCPGGDEERNNEDLFLKGSWFLSSGNMGTHDIAFGYDQYTDVHVSNNYQSPSNHMFYLYSPYNIDPDLGPTTGFDPQGNFYPTFEPEVYMEMDFWPILQVSRGGEYTTDSLFVNDTWRLNENFTFSAGLRYDKNDGVDGSGITVSDDSRVSPRLGVTWDMKGDGNWLVHASFGRYVGIIDANESGEAGGGSLSWFGYIGEQYTGPPINVGCSDQNPGACEYTSHEALQIFFNWFDSVGGLSNTSLWYGPPSIGGVNLVIPGLDSPYTDELSVGLTKRLGSRGMVRADYVFREGGSFMMNNTTLANGTVLFDDEVLPGVRITEYFDKTIRENDNDILERTYHGLHTMFQYRFGDSFSVGGTWTWSHLYGNFNGENSSNGMSVGGALDYPEYRRAEWNYPDGNLSQDQRHRVKLWGVWEMLATPRHNLNLSFVQHFWSGTPYSAASQVYVLGGYDYFFEDPGYVTPPTYMTYYYEGKLGNYTTDDIMRTDFSLNYSFFANLFGTEIELYVQPEILNLFNHDGVVGVGTTVRSRRSQSDLAIFDPFTTPIGDLLECPQGLESCYVDLDNDGIAEERFYHWQKDGNFGEPLDENSYQLPRTYRVSFGIRF